MNANVPHNAIDHTIDRALSALHNAQPRSGLEGRILTSLEHRATTPQPARLHLSAHIALWTSASAAVLAIASLLILHHRATPTEFARSTQFGLAAGFSPLNSRSTNNGALAPAQPAPNTVILSEAPVAMPVSPAAPSSRPETSGRHPERSAIARSRRTPVFENCSDHHKSGCPTLDTARQDGATTPTDAQALADLHAPSHPAPPLPLTPQERLFLHMLHYGNATELAELDPMVRAQQDAAETADFKTFFPDPPPLHQPGDPE